MKQRIIISVLLIILSALTIVWWSCTTQKVGPTGTEATELGSTDLVPLTDVAASPTAYLVQGNVVNDWNGGVLSGVTIRIGTKTATTNASGDFTITGLAAGTYQVLASKTGLISLQRTLVIDCITCNKAYVVNLSLEKVQPAKTIGKNGGTVTTVGNQGTYTLTIPKGALSQNTAISLSYCVGAGIPAIYGQFVINAVNILPEGQPTNSKVTLKMPLTLPKSTVGTVHIVSYNYSTNTFASLGNATITSSGGKDYITVSFSKFQTIIAYVDAAKYSTTKSSYTDSVVTTAVAHCNDASVTYTGDFLNTASSTDMGLPGPFPWELIKAQFGSSISSITHVSGTCTRPLTSTPEQIVKYGVTGDYVVYKKGTTVIGNVHKPLVAKYVCKDGLNCHVQGSGS